MGNNPAIVLCVQIVLTGLVSAAVSPYIDDPYIDQSLTRGLIFDMEQSVQGNGFSNSYLDASFRNLSLSGNGHGSGSYNYESLLGINGKVTDTDITGDYSASGERIIDLKENTDFVYVPSNFYLGKSMKWAGFQSLGSEETCLKNYGSKVSMNAAFDQLSTLSKNVSASLLWKSTESSDINAPSSNSHGKSNLAVDAAFSGKGHIGALVQGNEQNADILIDEDYLGNYYISKNMTDEVTYKLTQEEEEWLPCCYGGYLTIPTAYMGDSKLKGARGVFDCTCFKAPAVAEFPRIYPVV